jgi:anti-sigma factor RsiW
MRCEEASRYLSPYLDSELDPKTSFEISGHLEHCESCHGRFEAERRIEYAMSAELKKSQPRDEEIWNRAKARVLKPRGKGWLWAIFLVAIVAGATALVAIGPRVQVGLAQEIRAAYLALEAGRVKLDVVASDPKDIEAFCHDRLGMALRVPGKIESFELEGARQTSLRGATTATLSYRSMGRRIVVVVFSADHLDRFPNTDRIQEPSLDEAQDPRVVVLRSGWKVIGAAGAGSAEELAAACRAFQE